MSETQTETQIHATLSGTFVVNDRPIDDTEPDVELDLAVLIEPDEPDDAGGA